MPIKRSWLIHPEKNRWCHYWDKVVIPALMFTCTVTPYEVAFINVVAIDMLFVINRFIDAVFIIDMTLQFFLMYPDCGRGRKMWITNPRMIAMHYFKSWFLIDLVSIMPFDLAGFLINVDSSTAHDGNVDGSAISRLRLLKVLRCLRLLKLARIFRASRILKRWQSSVSISQQKLVVAKFLTLLVIVGHWIACIWGMVGLMQESDLSWVSVQRQQGLGGIGEDSDSSAVYIASVYWSVMTLTSIGYGDIHPVSEVERWLCVFIMFASGIIWANVIGGFSAVMASLDQRKLEFRTMIDDLNVIMDAYSLPSVMRRRLRHFFHQKFDLGATPVRLNALLEQMSPALRHEMCMYVNSAWSNSVDVLRGVSDKFIVELSRHMDHEVHAADEHFGDAFVLYILHRGVVSRKWTIQIVVAGKVWGDDFTLDDVLLIHDPGVLSLTMCEVLSITKRSLLDCCAMFPLDKTIVRSHTVRLAIRRGILRRASVLSMESDKMQEQACRGRKASVLSVMNKRSRAWETQLQQTEQIPAHILSLTKPATSLATMETVSYTHSQSVGRRTSLETLQSSLHAHRGLPTSPPLQRLDADTCSPEGPHRLDAIEKKLAVVVHELEEQKNSVNRILQLASQVKHDSNLT